MLATHLVVEDVACEADIRAAQPTHRLKVRADGRCAVRAMLSASDRHNGIPSDIATNDTPSARAVIRAMRIAAAEALEKKMGEDPDVACAVYWSFPDERYQSFEEWRSAQASDDTCAAISDLWRGGGQWTIYGLGILLQAQVFIHVVDGVTRELRSGANGM